MEDLTVLLSAALDAPPSALRACLEALVAEAGPERSRAHLERAASGRPHLERAASGRMPGPRSATDGLTALALVVERAENLEALTRPLLEVLHDLTGLASIYLTVVHLDTGQQEIRFSLNSREGFAIPEGLQVPWSDTLCQRALVEGRACTTDVPAVWGDSDAARALSIKTYVSVPVRLADGTVWGTLCGADSRPAEGAEQHLPTMGMIARLTAVEVQRAAAHAEAQRAAEADPLTGCANRRGVDAWLGRARAAAGGMVCAVYVDLDDFKSVNDVHGHAVGDLVLCEAARVLRGHLRSDDLVGRLGGDEFLVAAVLDPAQVAGFLARWTERVELRVSSAGRDVVVRGSVGTAVVPPSEVDDLLTVADRAMYAVKARRHGAAAGAT